jgi:hypothetical protein
MRIPPPASSETAPSERSVPATSSAPHASTTETPAAIFQSSPTMKFHQKRPNPSRNFS